MKILLVQDFLRSGGTERQSVLLANAFAAAGHDATLLTFRPGGALGATVSASVRRLTLQPFDSGLDWFAPRLLATGARLRPDVILCMGRMANEYAGSLQKRLAGRTIVVATMRTGKSLPWLFRRSLRLVRHVVANSHEARDTLATHYGIERAKLSVIHNALVFKTDLPAASTLSPAAAMRSPSSTGPDEPLAAGDSLRSRYGASATTTVLLCVAMFRPGKNQRELIEIAAGLSPEFDWQLWLAGEGPTREACEQLAREKKLLGRVRFPGFVPDPSHLYATADIAVHASRHESLSNFLIEAQAHGLPAVAYQAQGVAECFVPGQTGWVIARGDRPAFRAAIERLAAAPAPERAARAAAASHHARTTFDPAYQITAYLELFERLRAAG